MSGIVTYQTGFPIRITSGADNELFSSVDFEAPGEPNLKFPFKTGNPRGTVCAFGTGPLAGAGAPPCVPVSGFVCDPNLFDNTPYDPSSGPKTDLTAVTAVQIG